MRKSLFLCAAAALVACGDPAGPDDRWADPTKIEYAASLDIDLSRMNRTDKGLYWEDLVVGTGDTAVIREPPDPLQTVRIHYYGWFPDGTMFETSRDGSSPPASFPLGGGIVIQGMEYGVEGMQVGGKRKLVIPPELAYGRRGNGPIPPLATLIFEIELIAIE